MGEILKHNFTDDEIVAIYYALQLQIETCNDDIAECEMSKADIASAKRVIQHCQSAAKPFYNYLKSHGVQL